MIKAKLLSVHNTGGIFEYTFKYGLNTLCMLGIDECLPNKQVNIGSTVILSAKSTDIIISKSKIIDCSLENFLECKILKIDLGKILTSVTLHTVTDETILESLISTKSAVSLNLMPKDTVFACIKPTSLYVQEIYKEVSHDQA